MNEFGTALTIHFSPLLPAAWLFALCAIGCVLLVLSGFKNKRGLIWRAITLGVFMLALTNPSLLEEQREAVKDVAVIVVDKSQSQKMGKRPQRTQAALSLLQKQLKDKEGLELRVIEAPGNNEIARETRLFESLDMTLSDVPQQRRAGVIFLTDGQIHDVPDNPDFFDRYGPVHGLLTGDKNEKDRQLVIIKAPAYGIIGESVSIKFRIEDTGNINKNNAIITLKRQDGRPETFFAPIGEEQTIEVEIEHAGQNVYELSAQNIEGEITQANNRAALLVNGVRDRLRVLLVSGQPHAGGRTWRDLLTSDPGVDLIHFTILREPNKLDNTPQKELSLIAFPFRELFEVKLYDFDLIVFDRYRLNRILPRNYFNNIVKYVEGGGALLEASGPSYASEDSIYYTSLMKILPGVPTGAVIHKAFTPTVTENGKHHPVTRNLLWNAGLDNQPVWGRWLRQVVIRQEKGETLMSGADDYPLLVLDRVGQGRVAQLTSDHIWLWSRGYESGGPYAELLRRVVHWLMKEPELDERALEVKVDGNSIIVRSQNYKQPDMSVTMTKPDGTQETIILEKNDGGQLEKEIKPDQLGIYAFEDPEGQRRFAVIGDLNPPELRGVKTTPDLLAPLTQGSKGSIQWLADNPALSVRLLEKGRSYAGRGWIGLRQNHEYNITGVKDRPLLPEWAYALILLGMITLTWWREGQTKYSNFD